MSIQETEFKYADSNSLTRLIDKTLELKNGHRFSGKKGKFAITPPTSPTSTGTVTSYQNGVFNKSSPASPRLMSDSSDAGIDGHFKFLEGYSSDYPDVFTISNGNVNNDTLSDRSRKSQSPQPESRADTLPGKRSSNFSEDRYKWNDTEQSGNADKTQKKTNCRMICFIAFFALLVLALIVVGGAVILVYKVFDDGETVYVQTTIRPEILTLVGDLDLKETWTVELADPNSPLYISTAENFTLEMDTIMENSSFSDSYIKTEVTGFRPGSINVRFNIKSDRYRLKEILPHRYASRMKEHMKAAAVDSSLAIDANSVQLDVEVLTTTTTISTSAPQTSANTTTSTTSESTTTTSSTSSTTTPTTTTANTTTSSTSESTSTTSTTTPTTTSTTTTTTTTTTTAPDLPPVAHAGSDVIITLPERTAMLDGSSSTDDRGISAFMWQKLSPESVDVDMLGAESRVLSLSNLQEGTYIFRLTVTDTSGQTDADTAIIIVKPAPTTTTVSTTTTTTTPTTTTAKTTTAAPDCMLVNFTKCSSRGFTHTLFPNYLSQSSEQEAVEAFNIATEKVGTNDCSESVYTYLCSLYFPKCDPLTGALSTPCRSLCIDATTSSCGNYFYNHISCDYYPVSDCITMTTTTIAPTTTTAGKKCEETRLKQCRDLGFNETTYPNHFGESRQDDALVSYYDYMEGVVNGSCHKDIQYFICSIQFPKCVSGVNIEPCRRTCQAVIATCPSIEFFFDCNGYKEIDCMAPLEPIPLKYMKARRKCLENQFTCGKVNKCIDESNVCNGVDDCGGDWTDEMDCDCGEYEFQCDMGMCIKSYERCDGEEQCPDRSDESNCNGCTRGEVKCGSGECIMSEWLCDGRADCKDGSDEYSSDCDVCGYNQFTCTDTKSTCIDLNKRCDGVDDCPGGYDEWDCINHEKGILEISYMKFSVPVCSASWDDSYGNDTCISLLGEGVYIDKTDIAYNVHAFASLSSEGRLQSVLGNWDLSYDCPGSKAVRINCEPRGCGKQILEDLTGMMVNGEDAMPGSWPWHVALYFGGQYFCGGTLISDSFVLTAAHCVEKFAKDFSFMTVKLGANNRKKSETTQHVINVEAIQSHTDHVYFKKNDIALLQLDGPVNFTKYIQPICLPKPDDPLPLHSTCFTIGWGKTKWDGDYAEVLQQLKMTLWDTQKCNSSIAWDGEVYDTFLCAGYYSGVRSICKKDSGGPLLCLDKDKTWKLRGINSYVGNYCNMTERPNVFTNVSMFRGWLDSKIECKFRCGNNKCLYYDDKICDRVDDCGDNSDEVKTCNLTVTCDFEDKFLCGYEFDGWKLGYDNKLAASIEIDGQTYTQSNAPQFDHTRGRYPGHFVYGKEKDVLEAKLWSPRFETTGQTCIRFAYYQRGEVKLGLIVYLYEYRKGGKDNDYTVQIAWSSLSGYWDSLDTWKTVYFDISLGEFKLNFWTGDLLTAALDDIVMIPGMCNEVLCNTHEFWCRENFDDRCIPQESNCNLAIDCYDAEDEIECKDTASSYLCTFDNGNLCALKQEVGDASDWWLVNGSFVRAELASKVFVDHTSGSVDGYLFYINAYGLQTSSKHLYMWQLFYLHSLQYCFSFFYQMKSTVNFNIHVDCEGCTRTTYVAQSTFDDNWTLFQLNLPVVDVVNITYDVKGNERSENYNHAFIAMDDITVKHGVCPEYVCPVNYMKCKSSERCIPQSALCDRVVDCTDESDEEQCVCTADEFKCHSGRCISNAYKCDRSPQCLDSSDEGDVCKPLLSVSCTFEHPYICGYEFLNYTKFHWQRHQGRTLTPFTGPMVDHTYRNETGHYMYTEANEGSQNDTASLISTILHTGTDQSVEFYYHVLSVRPDSALPGVLQFSFENMQTQTNEVLWQASVNDLKDAWRRQCFDLPEDMDIRLWFTVIRNETTRYGVDMAIDDVKLNSFRCSETTQPPTTEEPTSTTMSYQITTDSTCQPDEFKCADGSCIDSVYRCDQYNDCPYDNSDEVDCTP